MANPSFIDSSKSCINNIYVNIASNFQACAFKVRQSPTAQNTAETIARLAPTAIAMVFTYYAPARVTFLAFGFVCFLSNNKVIELKRVGTIIAGIALGILLTKSVVATVALVVLAETACYHLRTESARHSAARNELNKKLLKEEIERNNKPKVEDVTDEVSTHEVSENEDGSQEAFNSVKQKKTLPLAENSVNTEQKLPRLHINDSDTEDEVEASTSEESSDNYYHYLRELNKSHQKVEEASTSEESSSEYNSQEEIK